MFADFQNQLFSLFDGYIERLGWTFREHGFHRIFGPLYERLFSAARYLELPKIQSAFLAYIKERGLEAHMTNRGEPVIAAAISSGWLTARQAQKELKISREKFDWLVKVGVIRTSNIKIGGQIIRKLRETDIGAANAFLANLLRSTEIRSELGISTPLTGQLLEAGLIKALRGPNVDGHRNWIVCPEAIDEFRSELTRFTVQIDPRSNTLDLFSFAAATAALRSSGVTSLEFVKAISSGLVASYSIDKAIQKVSDLMFDRGDVQDLIKCTFSGSSGENEPTSHLEGGGHGGQAPEIRET